MNIPTPTPCRQLVLILGDQLDDTSSAFEGLEPQLDVVLMVEAIEEIGRASCRERVLVAV